MPNVTAVPGDVLVRLRQFDTPTICNVVELFDDRPRTAGYMDSRIQACYPQLPPMVGYAATATFRASAPPRAGNVYAALDEQVKQFSDFPGPVVVVFQDLDSPSAAATFGEVMCTTYQSFGAIGLITSGTGRDLDQVAALNFPCFTAGTVCAHGYCQIVELTVPVHVGGVLIHPGDLLHGDRNGVTTIPNSRAAAVAEGCAELAIAEAVVLDYLKNGGRDPARFAAARKECKARIDALTAKLKVGR